MSKNPFVLALRFLLELVILFAFAYWGWSQHTGLARLLWSIGLPVLGAALWGVFRVPGDPGDAPVRVPGAVRLLLEIVLFGTAVWAFYAAGKQNWALVFGIAVLLHYILSYDRILWLLKHREFGLR